MIRDYSKSSTHYIFVYGTMKRGFVNHQRIADPSTKFLGEFVTKRAAFWLGSKHLPSGLLAPVLFPLIGQMRVRGELYAVKGPVLMELDLAEGHPIVYERSPILLDGRDRSVQVYMYGADASGIGGSKSQVGLQGIFIGENGVAEFRGRA